MQVVAVYIGILRVNQNAAAAPIATSFLAKLHRVQTGGLASVQAWQKLMLATLATGDDKAAAISAMAADGNWQSRLLALEAARESMGPAAASLADELSSDKDPDIREYAIALSQSLRAAATQPSDAAPASPSPVGNAKE
jgi:hypothetical protein